MPLTFFMSISDSIRFIGIFVDKIVLLRLYGFFISDFVHVD